MSGRSDAAGPADPCSCINLSWQSVDALGGALCRDGCRWSWPRFHLKRVLQSAHSTLWQGEDNDGWRYTVRDTGDRHILSAPMYNPVTLTTRPCINRERTQCEPEALKTTLREFTWKLEQTCLEEHDANFDPIRQVATKPVPNDGC
jgi:hypothetical protein